ncbi:MAG: hypothetical protein HQK54_04245 [Oligoflexales bacterium]|nr:hypothetical protein [Oligoflexales bacterium]
MSGVNIVGVQFRKASKIYDFDGKDLNLSVGDKVVVDTERGLSLAQVVRIYYATPGSRDLSVLKPVIRIATSKDLQKSGRLTPEYAKDFTKTKIKELNLDMHIISVDVQFGGNKVIVHFSAPGRVDFRELVKELASGLKTRVELKQIGSRDEAKQLGGLGICGREFCCASFLREFLPVSIKMAKNQNLALNPSKVSGGCGRLLCCLTYEDEAYIELRKRLLPKKTKVRLPNNMIGMVIKEEILNQKVVVETSSGELLSYAVSELKVIGKDEEAELEKLQKNKNDFLDSKALPDDIEGHLNISYEYRSQDASENEEELLALQDDPMDSDNASYQESERKEPPQKTGFDPRQSQGNRQEGRNRENDPNRGGKDHPNKKHHHKRHHHKKKKGNH